MVPARLWCLEVDVDGDGTVVAAEDVVEDVGAAQLRQQTLTDEEIVDAPSDILGACLKSVAPPRVSHFVGMKVAEGVHKSALKHVVHGRALLVRKSGAVAVGLWIADVYFAVRHVEVAADDYGLGGIERADIIGKGLLPLHTVVQPRQSFLRIGRVYVYEVMGVEIGGDDTSFTVVLGGAYAHRNGLGLTTCQYCRAAVALTLGIVPVMEDAIAHRRARGVVTQFGLLQTQNIGVEVAIYLVEAFAHDSA